MTAAHLAGAALLELQQLVTAHDASSSDELEGLLTLNRNASAALRAIQACRTLLLQTPRAPAHETRHAAWLAMKSAVSSANSGTGAFGTELFL